MYFSLSKYYLYRNFISVQFLRRCQSDNTEMNVLKYTHSLSRFRIHLIPTKENCLFDETKLRKINNANYFCQNRRSVDIKAEFRQQNF